MSSIHQGDITGLGNVRIKVLDSATYPEEVTFSLLTTTASDTLTLEAEQSAVAPINRPTLNRIEISIPNVTIEGMHVTGSSGFGVLITGTGDNTTLTNCLVENNPSDEIRIIEADNVTIETCTIYDDQSANLLNIFPAPAVGATIRNTIFYQNFDLTGPTNVAILIDGLASIANADHNLYFRTGATLLDAFIDWDGTGARDLATWQAASPTSNANSLFSDPLFRTLGTDFHLQSTGGVWNGVDFSEFSAANSPGIDAGDPTSPFGNEPDPNGGIINIGRYGNTAEASLSNDLPVANDDSITAPKDGSITADVLFNDTDADGDTLTITGVTQGTIGGVTFTANDVTYTPNAGVTGADSFTYDISDGKRGVDTGTVNVLVRGNGQIAFTSLRDGNSEVYSMNDDGSGETNLTNTGATEFEPRWSPDGTKILFLKSGLLNTMNADGTGVTQISIGFQTDGAYDWSPKGDQFVVGVNVGGNVDIHLVNLDGTLSTKLTTNSAIDSSPSWSPDGTQIAFVNSPISGDDEIFTINVDGTNPTQLTSNAVDDIRPYWSPDGTKIAFTRNGPTNLEVYTMNADGSGVLQLTSSSGSNAFSSWSPDGTKIALQRSLTGAGDIYSMNSADGTALTRLTESTFGDRAPHWGSNTTPITCEINITGDLNFGTQDPLSGPGVEKTVILSNGELLASVVNVFGTDWNDGAGPAEMDVGQTRFGLASDTYGNKTPLPLIASPASLTTINGNSNSDTFWQLDVVLNAGSKSFTGIVQNVVTFEFGCQ